MGSGVSFVFYDVSRALPRNHARRREMSILFWVMICVVGLLAARLLVFQASCALVDVQPNVVKSFILPGLFWVGMVVLAYALLWAVLPAENRAYLFSSGAGEGRQGTAPPLTRVFLVLGLTVLAIALISWPVYLLTLPTSLRKSFLIASLDQLLLILLAALVTAVVMVILALVQVATMKPG
jgi:hypothetical protein